MPRRKKIKRRERPADARFHNRLVTQFVNSMMWDGKKTAAAKCFYGAMDILAEQHGEGALTVFKTALDNVKPILEVKSRRVGGATYQVPVEVPPERQISLAIRWLLRAARERKEKSMAERLANEFVEASRNQGTAVKHKEDTHRMAEANKAFAHYRW